MRIHSLLALTLAMVAAGCSEEPTTPAPPPTLHVSSRKEEPQQRDILYQARQTVSAAELAALGDVLSRHQLAKQVALAGGKVEHVKIGKSNGQDEAAIAAEMVATGAVEYAEVDALVAPAELPNDALYGTQWHHAAIHSEAAWNYSRGSAAVTVAVCDGGVELSHPDLAANIHSTGYNVVDYTNEGGPMPNDGLAHVGPTHGTRVADMIGAVGNNGIGVSGVNWVVEILPIRVTNDTAGSASLSKLIECVDYARTHGAKVVNISYSQIAMSSAMNTAGQALMAAGGLLVVCAGNDALDMKHSKNYPGIIVVGGTDEADALVSFSNYGPPIDLVAPAIHISTTQATWRGATYIQGVFGTSFSSPIVAGVAALIWAAKPAPSPAGVQEILFNSAQDLGTAGYDTRFGNGRVDAGAALALAIDPPPPPPPPPPGKGKGNGKGKN